MIFLKTTRRKPNLDLPGGQQPCRVMGRTPRKAGGRVYLGSHYGYSACRAGSARYWHRDKRKAAAMVEVS